MRWKRWAIGAGVVALLVILGIATEHSRGGSSSAAPPASPLPPEPTQASEQPPVDPNQPITVYTPMQARADRRANKDWNKVVEALYRHRLDDAKRKLDDYEEKWGESDETKDLRGKLDALGGARED